MRSLSRAGPAVPAAILEIDLNGVGRSGRLRESHVRIRPYEIKRVLRETNRAVGIAPFKHVKRQLPGPAPLRQFRSRAAVNVNLPRRLAKRAVVVGGLYPGKPVAAVDVTRLAVLNSLSR